MTLSWLLWLWWDVVKEGEGEGVRRWRVYMVRQIIVRECCVSVWHCYYHPSHGDRGIGMNKWVLLLPTTLKHREAQWSTSGTPKYSEITNKQIEMIIPCALTEGQTSSILLCCFSVANFSHSINLSRLTKVVINSMRWIASSIYQFIKVTWRGVYP